MKHETKGFINIGLLVVALILSIGTSALVSYFENKGLQLGSTVLQTQLTDTMNTFRTNTNSSLISLQADLNNTTSTDPGHVHTSAGISGQISIAKGGTGTSTTPSANQFLVGDGTGYNLTNALPDCQNSTTSIKYNASTRTWSCTTASFVNTTGDENIGGIKTFTSGTILSAGATSTLMGNIVANGANNSISTTTFTSNATISGKLTLASTNLVSYGATSTVQLDATGTTPRLITGATTTLTLSGHKVYMSFSGTVSATTTGDVCSIDFALDGTRVSGQTRGLQRIHTAANDGMPTSISWLSGVLTGIHTFSVFLWSGGTSACSINNDPAQPSAWSFSVLETPN